MTIIANAECRQTRLAGNRFSAFTRRFSHARRRKSQNRCTVLEFGGNLHQ
jgi:hypothetical protein